MIAQEDEEYGEEDLQKKIDDGYYNISSDGKSDIEVKIEDV